MLNPDSLQLRQTGWLHRQHELTLLGQRQNAVPKSSHNLGLPPAPSPGQAERENCSERAEVSEVRATPSSW